MAAKHLITGATGNVGGELVQQLVDAGQDVRAYIRNPDKASNLPPAAEIAIGDLDDTEALHKAADGIDVIFFMQAAPIPAQAQNVVDAAKEAGVGRIVVLSSIGTVVHPRPLIGAAINARDDVLRESGIAITYLRPNAIASNALWWKDTIDAEGKVYIPTAPGYSPPIDPYDIARVAATVMTEAGHEGHGYILNGPEALTDQEQVEILADVLGRDIECVLLTPEQYAEASLQRGTPEPQVRALQNLHELFRAGRAGILSDDVQNLTGTAPRTFREWCENHRADFVPTA
ncbi:NAD-dependent epimerase/dehydratase family protein [Kribbella antibiotica]|uniref:NAD-dependent epimerase/dehydratase family protein n=1 Tax=Kribbella antibiotica TaxID=190195 RepID=A0A4R4ZQ22_9ACTN|nr:NAD(P)H-binding protein [Kribbella antibiotica]TDD60266.1 NAD-dependent epimerase/dehydratase family protein [Kribbella antibiotica]